jgi:tetratricopeptide (TPR) repeat protein
MKNINTFSKNRNFSLVTAMLIVTMLFALLNCNSQQSSKIPITTKSEKAHEYYNEGIALAQKLRGQEAAYFFIKAIAEDDEFALAYLQLAFAQTTPKMTFKYLNKAKLLLDNVSKGERLLIIAFEEGINSDLEKQNEYLLKLIEEYPNDELAHNYYGNFLYHLPKYKDAIKHLKISLEINPELSQPYNMLGYSYRQLGNFTEAKIYFQKYIDLIQDDPNPYDSYAELLLKMGEFESSIKYYRKALELQPTFMPSRIGIATNLTLLDKHEDACNELELIETLSKDPGDLIRMHFAKAVINVDRGNFEKAINEIKMTISISKEIRDDVALGNDLANLGAINLLNGKFDESIKYFEKSIEYFEKSNISQNLKYYLKRQMFVNAGRIAYHKNDIETLKKYKEKYQTSAQKTMNPNEIRNTHELAGYIHLLEEDYYNAIYEFKQANQESPIILYLIGTAYEELGDIEKAQEIYESVANFN